MFVVVNISPGVARLLPPPPDFFYMRASNFTVITVVAAGVPS